MYTAVCFHMFLQPLTTSDFVSDICNHASRCLSWYRFTPSAQCLRLGPGAPMRSKQLRLSSDRGVESGVGSAVEREASGVRCTRGVFGEKQEGEGIGIGGVWQ